MPTSPLPVDAEVRHLAKVVESSDDAIVSKDLDSTILSWNRAAERIFGYSAEEAVGKSIRILIPEDRQFEEDHVMSSIRAGRPVAHHDTVRVRKDGSLVSISLTVSPVHDGEGRIIGASKIARDITARKASEAAARELAAVVTSSDDAIITKTLDGIITSWNPGAERIFGYPAAQAVGQSIRMLVPDDMQAEEDQVLARIRAGEGVDHYETTRRTRSGALIPISLSVSPLRDEGGRVVGASKIARDISEQVRLRTLAHQHAINSEKLAAVGSLVTSALDRADVVQKVTDAATALTTAEFGVFFQNVWHHPGDATYRVYALSGAAAAAFAGLDESRAAVLFGPTLRGNPPVRLHDLTQGDRDGRLEIHAGTPEGYGLVRSYLAVPVKGANSDAIGALCFGHSQPGVFTQEHERLAVGVAAWASVALENTRLYDEAQQANRLKDEFLAVLSHELRTPLNAIVGYAQLLRTGIVTGSRATDAIVTLERNAKWLTQIVDDVLDVSRIVTGKLVLDAHPVELATILDNAIATVRPAADAKGVRLETTVDRRAAPVSGDANRLQQVAWNLMSNAVKFTPAGGCVQVHLQRVDAHVMFSVSDTGIGISPEFLPFVFERFRQADSSSTRKTGGLGLGLAIVRHIVEMHGGTVQAESDGEGYGATLSVRLPLLPEHPAGRAVRHTHQRSSAPAPTSGPDDLQGVRVLAIDDEPDALSLLQAIVESAGAAVTTMTSPLAALEAIDTLRPDVLVVDIGMPEMDGYALIEAVRGSELAHVRDVPAAALTAFARAEDRIRALQAGFEMHLAKPIDSAELVASLKTLVRRFRIGRR